MSEAFQHTPDPTKYEVREWLNALPPTDEDVHVTKKVAAAAFFELAKTSSTIPEHVRQQSKATFEEAVSELEPLPGASDTFVITADELRGIIAQASIHGAAQAAMQIGKSLTARSADIRALEELFNKPTTEDDGFSQST